MSIPERWQGFRALPPDVKEALEGLIPLFEREGVLLAYLFGSLGKGQAGQDVDLALLTPDQPAFLLRQGIVDCLGTQRVDVVDLNLASPLLRFEIVKSGSVLYVSDQASVERFELATIRLYQDTRFLRRQQRDYLKRRMAQWS